MRVLLMPRRVRLGTALALLAYWSLLNVAPAAAGLAPSRPVGASAVSVREAELKVVRHTLEQKVVAQKLADYGVTPREVEQRLASMSDEDVHTLATASLGLPSGSDDALGTLIAILLIILLVILIMKLMNKEVVIK